MPSLFGVDCDLCEVPNIWKEPCAFIFIGQEVLQNKWDINGGQFKVNNYTF